MLASEVKRSPTLSRSAAACPAGTLSSLEVAHDRAIAHARLAAGEERTLDLEVPGGSEAIRGRVLGPDGMPVVGAKVWAERMAEGGTLSARAADVRAYSWEDGGFALEGLPRGAFEIFARHGDHTGRAAPIQAGTADVAVALIAPARLTGYVTTSDGKPPTAYKLSIGWIHRQSAHRTVWLGRDELVTDPAGRFELRGLVPSDRVTLDARTPDGSYGQSEEFALAPGQVKEVHVRLRSLGTVRGRLLDPKQAARS